MSILIFSPVANLLAHPLEQDDIPYIDDNNEPVPEIKVVKKKISKSLAFDDKIEYSVEGDAFHQVNNENQ